jgi:hypothetical protein
VQPECKWRTEPVGEAFVESLRAKAANVRWGPPDRDERFALFSKSGFVDGLEAQLDDSWSLFCVADIDDLLTPSSVLSHQY